jgi:hypothetical protein
MWGLLFEVFGFEKVEEGLKVLRKKNQINFAGVENVSTFAVPNKTG